MREIKFRAWDKRKKEMLEVQEIRLHTKPMELWCAGKGPVHHFMVSNDCVLMQYTGLKDRQGKEIYEGDIVRDEQWPHFLFEVVWCDGKGKNMGNQVGWSICDEKFCSVPHLEGLVAYLDINDSPGREDYYNGVVVGNIYENPELLENKK